MSEVTGNLLLGLAVGTVIALSEAARRRIFEFDYDVAATVRANKYHDNEEKEVN